jgi:hypothetical protein
VLKRIAAGIGGAVLVMLAVKHLLDRRRTQPAAARSQGRTRKDLYEEAKRRGIPGRSRMNKAELTRAIADHAKSPGTE